VKKIINIAVVGCADIAIRKVLPALHNLKSDFNLIAIASRDYQKAKGLAITYGCEAVEGYENLLKIAHIDAVYIPLPTGLHDRWVTFFLKADKHVYVEKPVSMSLDETSKFIALAKKKSLSLFEGYMFKHHNQHKVIKKIIRQGIIGDIRFFSSSFGFPPLEKGNIRYDPKLGGGALLDVGGYPLKAAQMFLGDLSVQASIINHQADQEVDIHGSALLKNIDGVGASISFGFDNFYKNEYEIWGTKGKISLQMAFTPPPDLRNQVHVHTKDRSYFEECEAEDQFIPALIDFADSMRSADLRAANYLEIEKQSISINIIRALSKD
jgi:NDP-hexose-3-ketoreductase